RPLVASAALRVFSVSAAVLHVSVCAVPAICRVPHVSWRHGLHREGGGDQIPMKRSFGALHLKKRRAFWRAVLLVSFSAALTIRSAPVRKSWRHRAEST